MRENFKPYIVKLINKSKIEIILFLGKTMRDYDESFKEMKKENFNLKLRIFFLEERLGQGKKTNADELANANLELKVRMVITVRFLSLNITFVICAIF